MASGLPDHYRGVDIKLQDLSELTIRPKYGKAVLASGSAVAAANTGTFLTVVFGKGRLYGGSVWLDYTLTQANSEIRLFTEQVYISSLSFFRMLEYRITNPLSSVVFLNKFDGVNYVYSAGISGDLTFESYLALAYFEKHGFTPTVHYRLLYALI